MNTASTDKVFDGAMHEPGPLKAVHGATRIDVDPADRLPPTAAAKYKALRNEANLLRGQHMVFYEEIKDRTKVLNNILARINELQSRRGLPDNDPLIKKERQSVEILRARLRELQEQYDAGRAKSYPAGRLVRRIENYIEDIRDPSSLKPAPVAPAPKVARASDIPTEIDKSRTKIVRLRHEVETIKGAPIPSADAKKIVSSFVNGLAANARPDLFPTIEDGRAPVLAVDDRAQLPNMSRAPVDAVGLIAWLFKDQMIAALNSVVDEDGDDSAALSAEDRKLRLEGVSRELLALERSEELLIEMARENLIQTQRREDADVRAVLGLSDDAPVERED